MDLLGLLAGALLAGIPGALAALPVMPPMPPASASG